MQQASSNANEEKASVVSSRCSWTAQERAELVRAADQAGLALSVFVRALALTAVRGEAKGGVRNQRSGGVRAVNRAWRKPRTQRSRARLAKPSGA